MGIWAPEKPSVLTWKHWLLGKRWWWRQPGGPAKATRLCSRPMIITPRSQDCETGCGQTESKPLQHMNAEDQSPRQKISRRDSYRQQKSSPPRLHRHTCLRLQLQLGLITRPKTVNASNISGSGASTEKCAYRRLCLRRCRWCWRCCCCCCW